MYILTHVFVIKEGGSHEKKDKLYTRKETGTDDDTRNRNYVFIHALSLTILLSASAMMGSTRQNAISTRCRMQHRPLARYWEKK